MANVDYLTFQLFTIRKDITEGHVTGADANSAAAWKAMDDMLTFLTPAGMSSDESDTAEGSNTMAIPARQQFIAKNIPWRSKEVSNLVRIIDRDRNTTNGLGNARPGNVLRDRTRRRFAPNSRRDAPPGLPINYYDKQWFAGLEGRDKRGLKPSKEVALPTIELSSN